MKPKYKRVPIISKRSKVEPKLQINKKTQENVEAVRILNYFAELGYPWQTEEEWQNELAQDIRRIDFIIVGAAKCGTTFVTNLLCEHPNIDMIRGEVHYFDYASKDNKTLRQYHSKWKWNEQSMIKLRGEKSPSYIYLPGVIERIKQYHPNIKIIVCLRNHIDRVISHFMMNRTNKLDVCKFDQAITRESNNFDEEKTYKNSQFHYIKRSLYSEQLEKIYKNFPKENVFIFNLDKYINILTKQQTIIDLYNFLGISLVHIDTRKINMRRGKYRIDNYDKHRDTILQNTPLMQILEADSKLLKQKYDIILDN